MNDIYICVLFVVHRWLGERRAQFPGNGASYGRLLGANHFSMWFPGMRTRHNKRAPTPILDFDSNALIETNFKKMWCSKRDKWDSPLGV